ncbi:bactofilin family protein [Sphingobacterium sp. SYP-B4668]|uniref:bactofilin family protein n=1 Tax=Sphingobacterium sp. SYP-B4668 TaxID=2996035 RepID=UPI0022DD6A11|nr:polymer-forming cytoskeletal protein [Sphingobacterium sp. SYP-B4668]
MFKKTNQAIKTSNLDKLPIDTVIAGGITIKGDIVGGGAIRIDGMVEGNIDLEKGVVLGEKAEVIGTIKSNAVIVYGKLIGNLNCDQLHLKSTGHIEGDLFVNALEVEMGGKYNGTLQMNSAVLLLDEIVASVEQPMSV